MALGRMLLMHSCYDIPLTKYSYNGTSDLQLERMNVYFNEVRSMLPLGALPSLTR